jgi:heme-degrading monooxygenase HmoA
MSVVKINVIEVPEGAGPEVEKRFADRVDTVENSPGFQGFQLLRPVRGDNRYFVVTRWESDEAFEAWVRDRSEAAHSGYGKPVSTGAANLEFEVALDVAGTAGTAAKA